MMSMKPRALIKIAALLTLSSACATQPQQVADADQLSQTPIEVTLLAFNDFHGHVQGPSGSVKVNGEPIDAGGAAYFAAHIAQIKEERPNNIVVAAGDLIGASPLISALFYDEPTIEVLDMAGLELSSVGNHEFDDGVDELLRIQHGGCHAEAECDDVAEWPGAQFQYLAANVRLKDSNETLFPPYAIREFGGIQIAFIGLVLEATPDIVTPSAIEKVTFYNEVDTVNALIPELQEQGIEAIVILAHEGGAPKEHIDDINGCPELQGPIVDIANGVHDAVDIIISGHTHQPYICEFNGNLVTSAQSFGRLLTQIDLTIDPHTRDIISREAKQVVIDHSIEPSAEILARAQYYDTKSKELAGRVVGNITADFSRTTDHSGQSLLGTLIADAQLSATQAPDMGNAVIAFMNPGGVRDAIHYKDPNNNEEGVVTFRQLHTVQPFNNNLVTMTLTGEQIHRLLEQQWEGQDRQRPLQVSHGFSYTWNPNKPGGQKVDPLSITLHGEPIDLTAEYRVTVNNFLANGGDAFTVLTEGKDLTVGPIDLDILVEYFQNNSPVEPHDFNRVQRTEE